MPSNDARRNLEPSSFNESFWDALGLGIEPFLCFTSSTPDSDRGRLISSLRVRNQLEELLGRPGARYSATFVFYLENVNNIMAGPAECV